MIIFSLQVLKMESDRHELAKKTNEESSANTEESEITETNRNPEILLQPLRYAHTNLALLADDVII